MVFSVRHYIGQLWKYLQINKEKFKNIVLAGDFNSNSKWDVWDRWWNHSDVLMQLDELGIKSLYHRFFNENQGEETHPTFFMYRKQEKPYHIDYVFASSKFAQNLINFELGNTSQWLKLSDHIPIMFEINFKKSLMP